jgi:hypothetical protein
MAAWYAELRRRIDHVLAAVRVPVRADAIGAVLHTGVMIAQMVLGRVCDIARGCIEAVEGGLSRVS